jgi:uncharacterized protein
MPRLVLVIHGAGEPRLREGKVYWEPLLGNELGPDYQVRTPRMPEPEEPHYQAWADRIAQLLRGTDRPVLVGHSFGASVLLKFLAQAAPRPAFQGLFLLAAPFWKADVPEYALTAEQLTHLKQMAPVFFYHSQDDAEVSIDHLEMYARALPQATFRRLDDRGHEFNQDTVPELVADIRGLSGS